MQSCRAVAIIPTTGAPDVVDAIKSVLSQTVQTMCYVVCDGKEYRKQTIELTSQFYGMPNFEICFLPVNVGKFGFYGHRVYSSFPHLVDNDYVTFLDQDNWFDDTHIETCLNTCETQGLDWCYSLRKIYKNDKFICNDDCESLGKHLAWTGVNHVDTNTYFIKRDVLLQISSAWHGKWGQDRVFLSTIAKHFSKFNGTGKYTVNYRLGGNSGSVDATFFEQGNSHMKSIYKDSFPWAC